MPADSQQFHYSLRIPLRLIDQVYGPDSLDIAGDDIVNALREVSDYPRQFQYKFDVDVNHPNPWYHALVVLIEGISNPTYTRFLGLLAGIGLVGQEG